MDNKIKPQRDFLRCLLGDISSSKYSDDFLNKCLEIANSELGTIMVAKHIAQEFNEWDCPEDYINKLGEFKEIADKLLKINPLEAHSGVLKDTGDS